MLKIIPESKGILFITGNRDIATFHTEPRVDAFRLFMSVVHGTVEQIEHWRNKKH